MVISSHSSTDWFTVAGQRRTMFEDYLLPQTSPASPEEILSLIHPGIKALSWNYSIVSNFTCYLAKSQSWLISCYHTDNHTQDDQYTNDSHNNLLFAYSTLLRRYLVLRHSKLHLFDQRSNYKAYEVGPLIPGGPLWPVLNSN
jgi:hypothetical protein